jgi:tRNA(fMet)-specific endonuclease VapC
VKYLLDTDHISFLQRRAGREFSQLTARMAQYPIEDFVLSAISFHEQVIGAHSFINRAKTNADTLRGYVLLMETLQGFSAAPVLPFDAQAIQIFDSLKAQRIRVSTMDLRIACIALANNVVLLTRNVRDFSKVPNLTMEDWSI